MTVCLKEHWKIDLRPFFLLMTVAASPRLRDKNSDKRLIFMTVAVTFWSAKSTGKPDSLSNDRVHLTTAVKKSSLKRDKAHLTTASLSNGNVGLICGHKWRFLLYVDHMWALKEEKTRDCNQKKILFHYSRKNDSVLNPEKKNLLFLCGFLVVVSYLNYSPPSGFMRTASFAKDLMAFSQAGDGNL